MNFGGFFDNSSAGSGSRFLTDMPYTAAGVIPGGTMAQPCLFSPPLSKSIIPPGLSLALEQPEMENRGGTAMKAGENFEGSGIRRSREEHESRSGSDNVEGISGEDQDASEKPPRKKRYHRHTPLQIQELEA